MTQKSDHLAAARNSFVKRYAPSDPEYDYHRHDFEIELDRLIYAAVAVGQEPFVREIEMFRDSAIKGLSLQPQKMLAEKP